MLKKSLCTLVLLTGFLAGCEEEAVSHSRYICTGNITIETIFTGGKQVEIDLDGEKMVLPRITSTSGAQYEDADGKSFWAMGKDAEFVAKKGASPLACKRG